ncbi:MAG: hypothetical protein ABW170_12685 [Candidatus Thiodiazotropha sp. L084R]
MQGTVTSHTTTQPNSAANPNADDAQQSTGQSLYQQASQSNQPDELLRRQFDQRSKSQKTKLADEFVDAASQDGMVKLSETPDGQHALAEVYRQASEGRQGEMERLHDEQGETAVDYTNKNERQSPAGQMVDGAVDKLGSQARWVREAANNRSLMDHGLRDAEYQEQMRNIEPILDQVDEWSEGVIERVSFSINDPIKALADGISNTYSLNLDYTRDNVLLALDRAENQDTQAFDEFLVSLPVLGGPGVTKGILNKGLNGRPQPIIGSSGQRIPFGFTNEAEFLKFSKMLRQGLPGGVEPVFKGSSVTGVKAMSSKGIPAGTPFDVARKSDFDVALISEDLATRASLLDGVKIKTQPTRIGPIGVNSDLAKHLQLNDLLMQLENLAGRKVDFTLFDSHKGGFRGETILVPVE